MDGVRMLGFGLGMERSIPHGGAALNPTYALGELERQTDARGQRICLYYDDLGRLTGKHYRTDDNCPSSPTLNVSYTYDQGTNGVGQRTRMDYGTGSYTTWSYDARGRLEYETQVINGGGNFLTQYAYNSADLLVWMRYPANNSGGQGETVNYTYNTECNGLDGSAVVRSANARYQLISAECRSG